MSQENVESVKEAVERFNRGDDAVFDDLYDAEAVWCSREDEPDTGVYRGSEAIRGLAKWWGPKGFTTPSLEFDPRVGERSGSRCSRRTVITSETTKLHF